MRSRRRFEPLGWLNELRCCLRLTAGVGWLDKPSIRLLRHGRVGTALVRAGERLAGASQNPLAPETAAMAERLGTTE
jgi:hypothetical protein